MDWLTTQEAAELLGISRPRVLQLCKSGDLEATKRGREWMVSRASVEARLESAPIAGAPTKLEKQRTNINRAFAKLLETVPETDRQRWNFIKSTFTSKGANNWPYCIDAFEKYVTEANSIKKLTDMIVNDERLANDQGWGLVVRDGLVGSSPAAPILRQVPFLKKPDRIYKYSESRITLSVPDQLNVGISNGYGESEDNEVWFYHNDAPNLSIFDYETTLYAKTGVKLYIGYDEVALNGSYRVYAFGGVTVFVQLKD